MAQNEGVRPSVLKTKLEVHTSEHGFQIEDQLCSESERRDLKRPTPTSRETDEAAQAELETEAEAASSSFFHTEKRFFRDSRILEISFFRKWDGIQF